MATSPLARPSHLAIIASRMGISQNEIARRTNLSYRTVTAAWHGLELNGRPTTSLETWVKIAKALPAPLAIIAPIAAAELEGLVVR